MTPKDYWKKRSDIKLKIRNLNLELAVIKSKVTIPDSLMLVRKATKEDIKRGQVFWYTDLDDGLGCIIVDRVKDIEDDFKSYECEDGCRYGIKRAWVEVV